MGFVYSLVVPTSAANAISSIASALTNAGWTLLYDSTNQKVLRCASYTVGNGDVGSAVLELTVQGSYVQFGMHTDWNTENNTPITPSTTQRRLPYGYVSGWCFYIYGNEYWFATVPANSDGTYRSSDEFCGGGIFVPPEGTPVPSPYKAIWVVGNRSITGGSETVYAFVRNGVTNAGNAFIIHPFWGREGRGNAVEPSAGVYVGHADQPEYVQPAVFNFYGSGVVGVLPYAYMTIARSKVLGTENTIGGVTLKKIYLSSDGSGGSLWVRIS